MNGQMPGPIIKGKKGDTFFVNVANELADSKLHETTSVVRFFIFLVDYYSHIF